MNHYYQPDGPGHYGYYGAYPQRDERLWFGRPFFRPYGFGPFFGPFGFGFGYPLFPFFGKYHFKVPDMNTCPVSTIYPFISQEIHFAEAVFSIMAARRSET